MVQRTSNRLQITGRGFPLRGLFYRLSAKLFYKLLLIRCIFIVTWTKRKKQEFFAIFVPKTKKPRSLTWFFEHESSQLVCIVGSQLALCSYELYLLYISANYMSREKFNFFFDSNANGDDHSYHDGSANDFWATISAGRKTGVRDCYGVIIWYDLELGLGLTYI